MPFCWVMGISYASHLRYLPHEIRPFEKRALCTEKGSISPEQRPVGVFAVPGGLQVIVDALQGERVGRHVADFGAFAQDAQVGHAPRALQVAHQKEGGALMSPASGSVFLRRDSTILGP
jgi:hypothetical protein